MLSNLTEANTLKMTMTVNVMPIWRHWAGLYCGFVILMCLQSVQHCSKHLSLHLMAGWSLVWLLISAMFGALLIEAENGNFRAFALPLIRPLGTFSPQVAGRRGSALFDGVLTWTQV